MDRHLYSFFNSISEAKKISETPEIISEAIKVSKNPEIISKDIILEDKKSDIQLLKEIIRNNRENILEILLGIPELSGIISPKEPILEDLITTVVPNIDKFVKSQEITENREEDNILARFKFLETEISKIASGGGAGDILSLTHPVKTISTNYTIARRDYYIGVNHTNPITIILPNSYQGRNLIIKDESGAAFNNPITISGTIDNDTQVILQVNNGSLQFIYNNGWKII